MLLPQPAKRGGHQVAAHERIADGADWLIGDADAVDFGLRAPERVGVLLRSSAPPTRAPDPPHGGCAWFTGICSVPDRVTWFARATDRTASRMGRPGPAPTVGRLTQRP